MKKKWIAAMALMMILAALCTACSKGDSAEDPSATELPTVTAPPASGDGALTGLAADDNHAPEGMTREEWLETLSEEQRQAEELTGKEVDELYKAIGKPDSAVYTASCLVEGGEDGILTYDGFFVSTTRFPNGIEYIMGTESN